VLESYIYDNFSRAYQAEITEFMPHLLSIDCHRNVSATAGIRKAKESDLMVEQYMPGPVEKTLNDLAFSRVGRQDIVEIGNLVATERGASQLLFILLLAVLDQANYRWIVFTATKQVSQLLNKLHFTPINICTADPSRLDNPLNQWGSYYDSCPAVLAGDLRFAIDYAKTNSVMSCILDYYKDLIQDLAIKLREEEQI